ncbi:hypothetical protein PR048_011763 [Dryococelus australis]|uniref:Uncharacterized protein n=1 Tax=Dryococelus australis TaxID=614101 RepID=A0ABQ9HN06_9NEOP|nr:hypothetical protein PR048_011763 [Dryococelus australis]
MQGNLGFQKVTSVHYAIAFIRRFTRNS